MAQLAIYLDEDTASRLDAAARKAGKSRSAWVRELVSERLEDRLPDWWFDLLGTLEDDRTSDEIIRDIRNDSDQHERIPHVR